MGALAFVLVALRRCCVSDAARRTTGETLAAAQGHQAVKGLGRKSATVFVRRRKGITYRK
jgi:hypothetical protein